MVNPRDSAAKTIAEYLHYIVLKFDLETGGSFLLPLLWDDVFCYMFLPVIPNEINVITGSLFVIHSVTLYGQS